MVLMLWEIQRVHVSIAILENGTFVHPSPVLRAERDSTKMHAGKFCANSALKTRTVKSVVFQVGVIVHHVPRAVLLGRKRVEKAPRYACAKKQSTT